MKTEMRIAGLLGSITFLVVATGGVTATNDPLHAMTYGVLGAMAAGVIGHRMGHIISHPKNKHHRKQKHQQQSRSAMASHDPLELKPLTGDETFLDDL